MFDNLLILAESPDWEFLADSARCEVCGRTFRDHAWLVMAPDLNIVDCSINPLDRLGRPTV